MDDDDDDLGVWNFIHGTGAGCASVVAWEGTHLFVEGGVAVVVFGGLTALIMHSVHRHRRHIRRSRQQHHYHHVVIIHKDRRGR